METWTFFSKTGRYDDACRAERTRYVCHGIRSVPVTGTNSTGRTENRLTLWIPRRYAWLEDNQGRRLPLDAARLHPGDQLAAGLCTDTGGIPLWQITGITRQKSGTGEGGWVITAA